MSSDCLPLLAPRQFLRGVTTKVSIGGVKLSRANVVFRPERFRIRYAENWEINSFMIDGEEQLDQKLLAHGSLRHVQLALDQKRLSNRLSSHLPA